MTIQFDYHNLVDRFWNKVLLPFDVTDEDCWEWIGSINSCGYGKIQLRPGKSIYAHRLSYLFHIDKELSDFMFVCHKCDSPSCVNPNHLFLGDQSDNMIDMYSKNRFPKDAKKQTKS